MPNHYSKIGQVVLFILLILLSLTVLYPVLHVIAVSFSNNNNVVRGEVGIIPLRPNLEAYKYMFRYNLLGSGFKNSLFILIVGTAISLLVTMMMAYSLAHRSLIGRRFFMLMITFTMMFSGGLIPTYIVVVKLKLIDAQLQRIYRKKESGTRQGSARLYRYAPGRNRNGHRLCKLVQLQQVFQARRRHAARTFPQFKI